MRRVIVIAILVLVLGGLIAGAIAARRLLYFGPALPKPDIAGARAALVERARARLVPRPGRLDESETWTQRRDRTKALCRAAVEALTRDDTAACLTAADEVLVLASTAAAGCDQITTLTARAMVARLADELRDAVLQGHGDAAFMAAFSQRLFSLSLTSAADVVEGERLAAEEMVWSATADVAIRRINRAANLLHLRAHWAPWTAFSRLTAAERRGRTPPAMEGFADRSYLAVAAVAPALDRSVGAADQWLTVQHGMATFFAIEAFRAARGRPPVALTELVPAFMPAFPEDPMHAGGFLYRVVPGEAGGRGYTLYSVGFDGIDNGGKACAVGNATALHSRQGRDTDYMIHPVPEGD
ncbi:MAG: hypothetical protein ACKVS8_01875 [Phycisphaerales bacterium]